MRFWSKMKTEISLVNQAFCDLFEIPAPPQALIGTNCSNSAEQSKHLFKDPDQFVQSVNTTLQDKKPVFNAYFELLNGKKLERDYIPVFDNTVYLGHLWVYKDLTRHYELEHQLLSAQKELSKLALTDPLTGLGNRRFLLEAIKKHIALNHRNQQPLSLCMIDLDDFKKINDDFGHDKGDKVLKEFSDFLVEQCRQSDILARFGGEEFVILMPNTNMEKAQTLVRRILDKLNKITISGQKLTFSAGVADLKHVSSSQNLIDLADKAMYEVKRNGKNSLICLTE